MVFSRRIAKLSDLFILQIRNSLYSDLRGFRNRPATLDITIDKGSTFNLKIQYQIQEKEDSDDFVGLDLSNVAKIEMAVRDKTAAGLEVFRTSNAKGGMITWDDREKGYFRIKIPSTTSSAWTWTEGVYAVELTYINPEETIRLIEGSITATAEIVK